MASYYPASPAAIANSQSANLIGKGNQLYSWMFLQFQMVKNPSHVVTNPRATPDRQKCLRRLSKVSNTNPRTRHPDHRENPIPIKKSRRFQLQYSHHTPHKRDFCEVWKNMSSHSSWSP